MRNNTQLISRLKKLVLTSSLAVSCSWAADSFVIETIRVDGLQHLSAGAVFNLMSIREGDDFAESDSAKVIRGLYRSGIFSDVQVLRDGSNLIVKVAERPLISKIEIEGNQSVDTEKLTESFNEVGLEEGKQFKPSLVDQIEQELKRQYFAQGKYNVKVTTEVTELENNQVSISFDIAEGDPATIKRIKFIGNEIYGDDKLLDLFDLEENSWRFWSKKDRYSKQNLSGDLEKLKSLYMNNGYIDFNINSAQVAISSDKQSIYITINITEGEQYKVKEIKLAGELIIPAEDLFPSVLINPGDVFSRKMTSETTSALTKRLGREGYAFANVNMIPEIDDKGQEVSITFFVDPGKKVYVRRIDITGNSKTRDDVVRREIRQMESGWLNPAAVEVSKNRLNRLGYFKDVKVETPAVPGTTDQVDVKYGVTETPSGSFMAGLGFSGADGLILNASVTQNNIFGTGKRVGVSFNTSDVTTVYSLSFNDPYYTLDGISQGYSLSYRETDAAEANLANYFIDELSIGTNFGLPLSENNRLSMGFSYSSQKITPGQFSELVYALDDNGVLLRDADGFLVPALDPITGEQLVQVTRLDPPEVQSFIAEHGNRFDSYMWSTTWTRDTRNRALFPTWGGQHRAYFQVALPVFDGIEYFKLGLRHTLYFPIKEGWTYSLDARIDYGDGYGSSSSLPFYENFYAGGPQTMRGFADNKLGPKDFYDDALGGAFRVINRNDIYFPLPFSEGPSRSFRMSLFVDVGNVWETVDDFDYKDFRSSVGLSATWVSPMGPLTFNISRPWSEKVGDETEFFQFSIGAQFR